jgi:hypothetical protein
MTTYHIALTIIGLYPLTAKEPGIPCDPEYAASAPRIT